MSDTFFRDIGVYALEPVHLLEDKESRTTALHDRLKREIQSVKADVAALFSAHLPELQATQLRIEQIHTEGAQVASELDEQEKRFRQVQIALQTSSNERDELASLCAQQECHAFALGFLQKRHSALLRLENDVSKRNWLKAATLLLSLQTERQTDQAWLASSKYSKELADWLVALDTELKDDLTKTLERTVFLDGKVLRTTSTETPDQLQDLFAACDKLALSQSFKQNLVASILQNLVEPYLKRDDVHFSANEQEVRLAEGSEARRLESLDVFASFLSSNLAAVFALLEPLIAQRIVEDFLWPALPISASSEDLATFDEIAQCALHYANRRSTSANDIIREWNENVQNHWLAKINTTMGLQIRSIVKDYGGSKGWETKAVDCVLPATKHASLAAVIEADLSSLSLRKHEKNAKVSPEAGAARPNGPAPQPEAVHPAKSHDKPTEIHDSWGVDDSPISSYSNDDGHTQLESPSGNEAADPADVDMETPDDDGWGLDDEVVSPVSSPKSPVVDKGKQKAVETDVAAAPAEEDGWGFDDPILDAAPINGKLEDKWDWQDQEAKAPESPLSVDASRDGALKPRGKRKLGATPLVVAQAQQRKDEEARRLEREAEKERLDKQAELLAKAETARIAAQPKFRTENMAISTQTQLVVDLANKVLVLITELSSDSHTVLLAAEPLKLRLFRTFFDIFEFFRATMPAAHQGILQVPVLGMQYANDLEWLAQQLCELCRHSVLFSTYPAIIEEAQQIGRNLLGQSKGQRDHQISAQRVSLLESLQDTNHFDMIIDEARFQNYQRSIRQIVHTLQRFAQVLRPVVSQSLLNEILGGLVKEILQQIMQEITNQVDIGEEESRRLNALCKMLHELEGLFAVNGESLVDVYVGQIWFKFAYLSEILDASMVDIMFLFDEGNLVDFSGVELVKLVRALFSDSPTRQRNIDKIMNSGQ